MKHSKKDIIQIVKKLGKQKGYEKIEDWYNGITQKELLSILKSKKHYLKWFESINHIILEINDYNMYFFKFKKVSNKWWKNNILEYLNWLEEKLNIKTYKDWYNLELKDITNNYGSTLITNYNHTIFTLFKLKYPNIEIKEWLFKTCPRSFWKDKYNIKRYLKWFEFNKSIKNPKDWYGIIEKDIRGMYGSSLLNKYNVLDLCKILYPKFNFLEWKFKQINNWSNDLTIKWIDYFEYKFNITEKEDWSFISRKNIINNNGYYLLHRYKSINNILKVKYDKVNLKYKISKREKLIFNYLKRNIKENIILNDRKTLLNNETSNFLEIDIWIPKRKIAIEVDGIQHYKPIKRFGGIKYFKDQLKRDKIKNKICVNNNIKLIRIPFYLNFKNIKKILKNEFNI